MTLLDYRSASDDRKRLLQRPVTHWLPWAIYLGMSWTWCIGMFLPVLLVRDFGVWGWVVFAVPNVIGAAAMGWVLKDGTSETVVRVHRSAIAAFSVVTAAYQLFFAFWIFGVLGTSGMVAAVLFLSAVAFCCSILGQRAVVIGAMMTLVASVGFVLTKDWVPPAGLAGTDRVFDSMPSSQALLLAPACALGFLLCPYLDATFHIARQRTSRSAGRAAFSVGFGFFFLAMILLSLAYAEPVAWILGHPKPDRYPWSTGIRGHWVVQLAFTIGIHWAGVLGHGVVSMAFLARVGFTVLAGLLLSLIVGWAGMNAATGGEIIYRLFLGFYGLVFPAYVWLCMLPGKGRVAPTKSQWIVTGITILVASPMYYLGFIHNKMMWLLPGVAVVLLARLFVRARPQVLPDQPLAAGSGTAATG